MSDLTTRLSKAVFDYLGPDYWLETNYAAQLDDLSVEQHGIVKELVRAVWREARYDLESALSISDSSIDAIRSMLRAGGVPEAPFIDDHVRNAIIERNTARSAALEEAAKVADANVGSAKRERMEKRQKLRDDFLDEILAEERGEDIASGCIATAIRALKEGAKP